MTRRSVTLVVSGVLIVALLAVASLFDVPYVVYSPGPTENTLGERDGHSVVQIEKAETFPTSGELDLTTVGITPADSDVHIFAALSAWIDPDRAVVPRELVYPNGTTTKESRQQGAALLESSQEAAKVAALRQTGRQVAESVAVGQVVDGTPADGVLKQGDVVVAVDGSPVASPQDVVDAVRQHEPGEKVTFKLSRGDDTVEESLETVKAPEGDHAIVGFTPRVSYDLPVEITIGIDERIGGPSAGMIFAVAIYDLLTPGELLDGAHIAGTGELSSEGQVRPIGGIQQKIAAASSKGVELFLAPRDNCPEAVAARHGDMLVVPVETLEDSIDSIETYVAGDKDRLEACPS